MVAPSKPRRRKGLANVSPLVAAGIIGTLVIFTLIGIALWNSPTTPSYNQARLRTSKDTPILQKKTHHQHHNHKSKNNNLDSDEQKDSAAAAAAAAADPESSCPYMSLSDLTQDERYPVASAKRHMVQPPKGGPVHLVCCQTTKGPWNIMVREKWSPLGSERVLKMINDGYFNYKVPLMRCIKNFLCQFGLNGPRSRDYGKTMPDEPNWLPPGPEHRHNELGVKRTQKGYFSYAGSGKDSRSNQIWVALTDVEFLGGGSPWEVPWGELVGTHSFDTLDQIETTYGEKGPSQGFLHNHDSTDPTLKKDFPLLDYVNSCRVVDHEVQQEH